MGFHLEPHFRFIRLELPGHGRTPLATCPSPDPVDVIGVVHEAVELLVPKEKKLVIIGHSLGAQLGPLH